MTRAWPALLLLLVPGLTSCGGQEEQTVHVLAAASLTEAFTALAEDYERDHPGVEVQLQLGSSTDLAETAAEGAPGDVLATADETSMEVAVDAGVTAAAPQLFALNHLVIVTRRGNPEGVGSLADLQDVDWVRCADDVPCGRVAVGLLDAAGVTAEPVSLEVDVKATLDRVVSGEVDAALVYASDAQAAAPDVVPVPIEGADEAPTFYYQAPLEQSADSDLARDWIALVNSSAGDVALNDAGFTSR